MLIYKFYKMDVNKKGINKYCFVIENEQSVNWSYNHTGGVSFSEKIYCVDDNHYLTQSKGVFCEVCNGQIVNRE